MFYEQNVNQEQAVPKEKSPARVAAGSRNGKLAAGKKSPAGLAASAQNRFKHGYYSRTFTTLGTENPEIYNEIRDALREEYCPATIREHQLLEEIAQYSWLLNRNFNIENSYLNGCIAQAIMQEDAPDDESVDVVAATVEGYKKAASDDSTLTLLYRHRAQIQRDLIRATKALDVLIEQRKSSHRPTAFTRPIYRDDSCYITRGEALRKLGVPSPSVLPEAANQDIANSRYEGNQASDANSRYEGNGQSVTDPQNSDQDDPHHV